MLTGILLRLLHLFPAWFTLKPLLQLDNALYELISKEAIRYNKGIHPKHRLTNYHRFFIENVREGDRYRLW